MKIPSIVRIPKYKRFDFQPRYYDPVKEELQERVDKIKREHEAKNNPNISFRQNNIKFERRKVKNKFGMTIQLYLVVFMLFDLFLLFKADNISNNLWMAILILQVSAVYFKVRFGKKKGVE